MKKILIIRLSSLGDIILTTPVIRCLSKQLQCEIHFVTRAGNAFLLQNNPYIHHLISVKKDPLEQLSFFRSQHYDQVIDLHNNLRSYRFTILLNRPVSRFRKLNIEKWMLVHFKLNRMPHDHIVDRYLEAVKKIGVVNDQLGLDYFLPPDAKAEALKQAGNLDAGYIVLVAGAKHFTKQIPLKVAQQIAQQIHGKIIVLGGAEDAEKGTMIATNNQQVINCCGAISFDASAWLISHARVVITSDTGLMHVAAAFKRQIITLWGNTVPEFGMYPYNPTNNNRYTSIETEGLRCRPCSKIGFNACPQQHFRCMMDADIAKIIATVDSSKTD